MKKILFLALALTLGGCTTVASTVATVATSLSSSTPTQVNTLADALQAATLATNAVDAYVNVGNPSRATLLELQTLNNGLHAALTSLQAANAAGQSLAMASFNAALMAFNAYSTTAGVQH